MDHIEAHHADPRSHKRCLSVAFALYSRTVYVCARACVCVCVCVLLRPTDGNVEVTIAVIVLINGV